MKSDDTQELFSALRESSSIKSYLKTHGNMCNSINLVEYLNLLIEKKSIKKSQIIKNSGLNRIYGYQILSGNKKPSRDKLICFCFGLELDIIESQKLLHKGSYNPLYPKDKRDSIIIYCICKGKSLLETNLLLDENQVEAL